MKTHRIFLGLLLLTGFAAQAQFDFVTNSGIAIIDGFTGFGGAVVIPDSFEGLPVTVIEGSGFENKGITSVEISDTVTNIGTQRFAPNQELTTFTVDAGNPAFSSAGGVLFDKSGATLVEYPPGVGGSYAIPGTVTSVGASAFAACYFVSDVTIPNSVTNLGAEAFAFCFDLTNVTIASGVSSIGPAVFLNCTNLAGINVAAGNLFFKSAGGVLFDKNETTLLDYPTALQGSYTIPSEVTTIGTSAFFLCSGLTGVTIPASVTSIEQEAFADCAGLTNVTLGAGVSFVDTSAFGGCANLTAINVAGGNPYFSSINGVVFSKDQTTLVRFPPGFTGGYTIPGSVTAIADNAFEDCALTDVIIPENVTSIGFDSFQGCGSLTNVTMANGVSSIGIFAFGDSPKLATVTITSGVTSLPYGAFAYDGLTSVTFEGNAPVTDPMAFMGESATIYYQAGTSGWDATLDGLTTAMEGAPTSNGALEVTILPAGAALAGAQWQVDGGLAQPSGATVLGLALGQHTVSFTTVNGWTARSNELVAVSANATNTATGVYEQAAASSADFTFATNEGGITITSYVGQGGAVDIPATITGLPVTGIGQSAFANNALVTSVTIPDSVTNLGDFAFGSCSGLEAVTISAGVNNIGTGIFEDCFSLSAVTLRGPVTSIGQSAFASCPELTEMAIPESVTNLGGYAFFADGLTNVTIPTGLTSIGASAFMDCNHLPAIAVDAANPAYASVGGILFDKSGTELVEFPGGYPASSYNISNGVTRIGDAAFEDWLLTNITMAASVTNIGNYSFENCTLLTSMIIPNGVVNIGSEAFALCTGLSSIVIPTSVASLGSVPFANCSAMTAILVASGNQVFSSDGGVLYDKTGRTLVEYPGGAPNGFTIPGGVEEIGFQAFEQTQVTTVAVPGSVTNIGLDAFFNCADLVSVTMADGVASIGVGAFESCYVLTNITFPASMTNIGYAAFDSCSALTRVVIPSSAAVVGDYCFADCGNLTTAYFEGNAPVDDGTIFNNDGGVTVYYLPGATGWGGTFAGATTAELPDIVVTAHPAHGAYPLAVTFTAAAVDGVANPVTNWNWNFGDGVSSATQNPSHTYEMAGVFAAAVVETNSAGLPMAGGVVTITVTPVPVLSGLVANGGFETGDFLWWNLSGTDPGANFVAAAQSDVLPHAGKDFAVLGSAGGLGYLSQTLATTAGSQYVVSLWLNSPDGLGPNEFLVSWNGTALFDGTNLGAIGWTNLLFTASATDTNTVLELGFRDDPSFLGLDEVSVNSMAPDLGGASVQGANLALDGINGHAGDKFVTLTTTNLALAPSQWVRLTTNTLGANGNFTITVTNTVSGTTPKRFYLLQKQ